MKNFFLISLLSLLNFADITCASDYGFVDKETPWHFYSNARIVDKAKLRTRPVRGHYLHYSEAFASEYYSYYINSENSLSWQAGYSYLHLGWDNPRFRKEDFHYAIASLAWVSHSFSRWRFVVNGGLSVDAESFNFSKTAVYYGLLWGRYHVNDSLGIHIGGLAYGGFSPGYFLPLLGMDWQFQKKWQLTAIFPIDLSLKYFINHSWTASLVYSGFGGPYKYPRRALGGQGHFHDAIFKVFATGIDLNIKYHFFKRFSALIGSGYNFGGWILIEDSHRHHAKYYKYNAAPYVQAQVTFSL